MPKTYLKTQRKKNKPKKPQPKTKSKPVSITTRKSYWITLTLSITVFASILGYSMHLPLGNIIMILASVLFLIGFAVNIRFKPSTASVNRRALFIFIGASIIGFSIWAITILSLNATSLHTQIASAIGDDFFAVTSLMVCLIFGAFVGDWIGEKRNYQIGS